MKRDIIWAFGGGVQTHAILVLMADGKLEKPTRTIMANTGRESSLTWRYIFEYTLPLMDKLGMVLEIAPHELATVDLYSTKGELLIPAYTETGKFHTFCSNEWKKRVNHRYLRAQGYGPDNPVTMWFGMSLDEVERLRISDVGWIENYYPLCFDVKLRRHECELVIEQFGLPVPPRSACKICPNRDDEEWLRQKIEAPEDHQYAIEFDEAIRRDDPQHAVYLHRDRVPFRLANIETPKAKTPMEKLCANYCWT